MPNDNEFLKELGEVLNGGGGKEQPNPSDPENPNSTGVDIEGLEGKFEEYGQVAEAAIGFLQHAKKFDLKQGLAAATAVIAAIPGGQFVAAICGVVLGLLKIMEMFDNSSKAWKHDYLAKDYTHQNGMNKDEYARYYINSILSTPKVYPSKEACMKQFWKWWQENWMKPNGFQYLLDSGKLNSGEVWQQNLLVESLATDKRTIGMPNTDAEYEDKKALALKGGAGLTNEERQYFGLDPLPVVKNDNAGNNNAAMGVIGAVALVGAGIYFLTKK